MNGWISVNERLPEEGELCIACTSWTNPRGEVRHTIEVADFRNNEFQYTGSYDYWEGYEICNVTHWMPAPSFP